MSTTGLIVVPGASWSVDPDRTTAPDRHAEPSGCGNDGAVETTDRFPPRLGNLAQTARFPHSHKPIPFLFYLEEDEEEDQNVTRDR